MFEIEQLLILAHNALDKSEKMFCVTIYLETKSFQTVQAKFCRTFNLTIHRKAKFIVGYRNFKPQGQ